MEKQKKTTNIAFFVKSLIKNGVFERKIIKVKHYFQKKNN